MVKPYTYLLPDYPISNKAINIYHNFVNNRDVTNLVFNAGRSYPTQKKLNTVLRFKIGVATTTAAVAADIPPWVINILGK